MSAPIFRLDPGPAPFPLFDVHVHVDPQAEASGAWRPLLEDANITRACIDFASTPAPETEAPDRRWSRGTIVPVTRLGSHSHDVRSTDGLESVRAVVLRPEVDDLPPNETIDRLAELAVPILVQVGTLEGPSRWHPERIVSALLPRLRGPLILAHLGALPCDAERLAQAVDLAARHPQVYLDTSAVWLAGFVTHAVTRVPEKLLFGSGYPMMHPRVAWDHVASAVTSDMLLEGIGRRHAEVLFGSDASHG